MPIFATVIHLVLEVLARAIRQEKEIKGIQVEKKEVKLSLICGWHDFIYTKHQRLPPKFYLNIYEYSKFGGYKINIQKSVVFLYTHYKNIQKRYGEK